MVFLYDKFHPMIGTYNTRIGNNFSKSELYDVTWDPEDHITELGLFRGETHTVQPNQRI